jgi:hypothetical protein
LSTPEGSARHLTGGGPGARPPPFPRARRAR